MPFQPSHRLPERAAELLAHLGAPPRLTAHLTLVHDVACELVAAVDGAWPGLDYDRESVRLGAALHDISKVAYPGELTGAGDAHETAGEQALRDVGMPDQVALFARTHAQWAQMPDPVLEDLLVAAADTWWRGTRNERLEAALCQRIAAQTKTPNLAGLRHARRYCLRARF